MGTHFITATFILNHIFKWQSWLFSSIWLWSLHRCICEAVKDWQLPVSLQLWGWRMWGGFLSLFLTGQRGHLHGRCRSDPDSSVQRGEKEREKGVKGQQRQATHQNTAFQPWQNNIENMHENIKHNIKNGWIWVFVFVLCFSYPEHLGVVQSGHQHKALGGKDLSWLDNGRCFIRLVCLAGLSFLQLNKDETVITTDTTGWDWGHT